MTVTAAQMVTEAAGRVGAVDPKDAWEELQRGDAVALDVREPVEWEESIPGALQVPRGILEFQADPASPRHNAALDPHRRVIVYCRSGARAALAAATLQDLGFRDVANLTDGITGWKAEHLPTSEAHEGF